VVSLSYLYFMFIRVFVCFLARGCPNSTFCCLLFYVPLCRRYLHFPKTQFFWNNAHRPLAKSRTFCDYFTFLKTTKSGTTHRTLALFRNIFRNNTQI
jgi:hypothetical protein